MNSARPYIDSLKNLQTTLTSLWNTGKLTQENLDATLANVNDLIEKARDAVVFEQSDIDYILYFRGFIVALKEKWSESRKKV